MRVLLNIDAGESSDEPEELYALADVVNVACGGHAGDDASMDRVIAACARSGTRLGAHPSYEDRAHFGRRALAVDPAALEAQIAAQCARLAERARRAGARVAYVKAHGALYHAANADARVARALLAGAARALGADARVIAPAHGEVARACAREGRGVMREAFADRGVRADGSLVPRGEPGALVTEPAAAAARARSLAESGAADTVCVHGDTPGAVAIARAVRAALERAT